MKVKGSDGEVPLAVLLDRDGSFEPELTARARPPCPRGPFAPARNGRPRAARLTPRAARGCRAACESGPHLASARALPSRARPTLGGSQLWADLAWDGGWRVQRHVWTGHARLLDEGDVRRAWGSKAACLAALRDHAGALGNDEGPVVVVLHGLWPTRRRRPWTLARRSCGRG